MVCDVGASLSLERYDTKIVTIRYVPNSRQAGSGNL